MAEMYPREVPVNEANIAKTISFYKRAYKDIVNELTTATDFGVANRRAILAQIDDILETMGEDMQKFIAEELPDYYRAGAEDAVRQLRNVGADVQVAESFNLVHRQAIMAILDETNQSFAEAISGIKRSATGLLGTAVKEELTYRLAKSVTAGEALEAAKKSLKIAIQENGITALKDKSGRSWTLDRYTEMLFRTKAVEARNRGLMNRGVENGYDLVQVSRHNSDHEECRVWEGKILSLTGKTKGYPTVDEAKRAGLFHPNCKHAINFLIPKLAKMTSAYDPDEPTKVIEQKEARELSGVKPKQIKLNIEKPNQALLELKRAQDAGDFARAVEITNQIREEAAKAMTIPQKTLSDVAAAGQNAAKIPELLQYEDAMNQGKTYLLDALAKRFPNDARFHVHEKKIKQPLDEKTKNMIKAIQSGGMVIIPR